MRMQDTAANCGPASVANALQALGVDTTQAECERRCKTTATDGTDGKGIQRAVQSYGRTGSMLREKRSYVAWLTLKHRLSIGNAVILHVDDNHWVAAVGLLGDRVIVADPADNELVLSYDPATLMKRWGEGGTHYGVIV